MAKIGRNDPCPCGSGKKYKQCHGPIDDAAANRLRLLRQAPDTLLPKLLDAVPRYADEFPEALNLFWNEKYALQTMQQLDEQEDRGSERFLTWFLFDYAAEAGTPLERLRADASELDLTELETELLQSWTDVHFQPFVVESVVKGSGFEVRPVLDDTRQTYHVEDRAATKRIEAGDIVIVHLLPVTGETHYITGAAAHVSADTLPQLQEFVALHLADLQQTEPTATYADLIRERSYIFNHFVMALPREEQEMSKIDELVATTRATLNVMGDRFRPTREEVTSIDDE